MSSRTRQRIAVLLVALAFPAVAHAAFNFNVQTSSPVTVPGVTLTGDDQSKTFTMAIQIGDDGAGNNVGWNMTASSTPLTSAGKTLPALQVTNVSYSVCTGSCNAPQNSVTWPVTLSTTAQEIFNAAVNTGEGDTTLTPTFKLTYPANALPGTYTGAVTIAATTGP